MSSQPSIYIVTRLDYFLGIVNLYYIIAQPVIFIGCLVDRISMFVDHFASFPAAHERN